MRVQISREARSGRASLALPKTCSTHPQSGLEFEAVVGVEGVEGFDGEVALPFEGGFGPGFGVLVPGPGGEPGAGGGLVLDFVVEVGGDVGGVDEVGQGGIGGGGEGKGFDGIGGPLGGVASDEGGDRAAELGEDEDVARSGDFPGKAEVAEEGVDFEDVGEVDEGGEGDVVDAVEDLWGYEGGVGVEVGDDFGVADGLEGGWGVGVVPPGGVGDGVDFGGEVYPEAAGGVVGIEEVLDGGADDGVVGVGVDFGEVLEGDGGGHGGGGDESEVGFECVAEAAVGVLVVGDGGDDGVSTSPFEVEFEEALVEGAGGGFDEGGGEVEGGLGEFEHGRKILAHLEPRRDGDTEERNDER